jgi:hypothetical protein
MSRSESLSGLKGIICISFLSVTCCVTDKRDVCDPVIVILHQMSLSEHVDTLHPVFRWFATPFCQKARKSISLFVSRGLNASSRHFPLLSALRPPFMIRRWGVGKKRIHEYIEATQHEWRHNLLLNVEEHTFPVCTGQISNGSFKNCNLYAMFYFSM